MSIKERHYKWLQGELTKLSEQGILDSASCERLSEYCSTKLSESAGTGIGGFFLTAMCVLGMLFITGGIVLLIAHNWSQFGKMVQSVIGMTPLAIAGVLSLWTLTRFRDDGIKAISANGSVSEPAYSAVKALCFREASALMNACGIAVSIGVISHIYMIAGELPAYMLAVLLLALPHIYIFRSRALFLLFICAVGVFNISPWRGDYSFYRLWGIALALSVLPFMLREFANPNRIWRAAWSYVSLRWLGFFICAGAIPCHSYHSLFWEFLLIFVSCICIKYLGIFWREKCTAGNGWRWGGLGYFLILFGICSFDHHYYYEEAGKFTPNLPNMICLAFFLVLLVVMVVSDFRKRRMDSERITLLVICAMMCLSQFLSVFDWHGCRFIFANIALGAYGVVMLFKGIRNVSLRTFNEGMLTIIVLVCCRFFDMDIGMLTRGICMILLGFCFCGLNVYFAKVLKKRAKEVRNV